MLETCADAGIDDLALGIKGLPGDREADPAGLDRNGAEIGQDGVERHLRVLTPSFDGDVDRADGCAIQLATPTNQSKRFLKLPGNPPAYPGVQNRTASAVDTASRAALFDDAALVLPLTSSRFTNGGVTASVSWMVGPDVVANP